MNELFGFNKKKAASKEGFVRHDGNSFVLPNGSIFAKSDLTLDQLNQIDWANGDLSWLTKSSFNADKLFVNASRQVVTNFSGVWNGGDFKGEKFLGVFNQGTFQGNLKTSFDRWKPSPYKFVDGTVSDYQDGLLGIKKINATVFDVNSASKSVSLLSIPLGYHVNISDTNGMMHSFTVVKTLDSTDSVFVLQSTTGSRNKAVISWSELRGSSQGRFELNTTITAGKKFTIPKVFNGDPVGVISYIEVSPKKTNTSINPTNPNNPNSQNKNNQNSVYKFNLADLAPLRFNSGSRKPLITLKFDTQNEVDEFGKMNSEIKSGYFKYHLKTIVNALQFDVIDGYGKNVYLQDIFGRVQGSKKAPADVQNSLNWLERFMRIFIINIVAAKKHNGQYIDSPAIQAKVMKQIAQAIVYYLPAQNPSKAPATKPTVKSMGKSKSKPVSKKTKFIKESISQEIFKKMFS
jgi:hypothetical protein|tara:strand:- start:7710 stop:9092 length:1383 start_codon:yes stop_codon:yes gene_type:complete